MTRASGWQVHQVIEFLTQIAGSADEAAAVEAAARWSAKAFGAEVSAVVCQGELAVAVGFPRGQVPLAELLALAEGREQMVDLPRIGACTVLVTTWDTDDTGRLVLARLGGRAFSSDEARLLWGVARSLTLAVRMLRVLRDERSTSVTLAARKTLFQRLSRIQRSIAGRAPIQQTLDGIVAGARDTLQGDVVVLYRIDENDPLVLRAIASAGVNCGELDTVRRAPVSCGAAGLALTENRLVVVDGEALGEAVGGVQMLMAAPVQEGGHTVGSVAVGSLSPGRVYGESEQEVLAAFAEHVSIALTDAKTVEAVIQALDDPLTGLPSRTLLLERLEHALSQGRRHGGQVAVLLLDLDRFQYVNDTLGHAAGDEVMIRVGGILRRVIRASDTAGRLGGDEFAVVIEGFQSLDEVLAIVRRILAALKEPLQINGTTVYPAATIGIALSTEGAETADALLRNADIAMYCGKQDAPGESVIYSDAMRIARSSHLELDADLRIAMDRHEFGLLYQPIVDLASGEMIGVEALLRWYRPAHGTIPPLAFIPILEETGQVIEIGLWVLRQTCWQLAAWHRADGFAALIASVNVSARQLRHPTFVDDVAEVLRETGVAPASLLLEITESAVIKDVARTIDTLRGLRTLGVRVALDDFGTGNSSLSHLLQLPLDVIKIDKSFIDDIVSSKTSSALAHAIIALGLSLDVQVIAEGIENHDQLQALLGLNCRLGQGYHFARPLGARDIDRWLTVGTARACCGSAGDTATQSADDMGPGAHAARSGYPATGERGP